MEKIKIGIPHFFFYYEEGKVIKYFLDILGFETIISENSEFKAKENICYSINEFISHIEYLKEKCDYIINIKFDNTGLTERGCSNFLATYDLVNNLFNSNIINITIDHKNSRTLYKELIKYFSRFDFEKKELKNAYLISRIKVSKERKKEIIENTNILYKEGKKILVLGHAYNINNELLMRPVYSFFDDTYNFIMCNKFDKEKLKEYSKIVSIKTESKYIKEMIGVIEMVKNEIDGIILISNYMCPFDSMLEEFIRRRYQVPYANIILKEGLLVDNKKLEVLIEENKNVLR